MELHWPLILFTTFMAWSAGLFATQGVCALRGEGAKVQMKALIVSVVLLVVGGISVFFHLEHWERIFNGFGHLSSGITQELIAIVVMVVVMAIMFAYLRRTADDPHIPAWVSVLAIVTAVVLMVACGHSYMMAARPAWDNILETLSLVGAACILGPATFVLLMKKGEESGTVTLGLMAGAALNFVFTLGYLISMSFAEYTEFDSTYFDPTSPTAAMLDVSTISPFSGDALWVSLLAIVGTLVALGAGVMGRSLSKKKELDWRVWGGAALAGALVGAVCLRVVFYMLGVSVFAFY